MNQPNDDKEKDLEDFLLDIDCLDTLDKWANKPNFFDILSVSGMEIRHSNFLAWLLDPQESHGLGDYFLRKLLQQAAKVYGTDNSPISIVDLDSVFLDDAYVLREQANIDVLVISEQSKIVLAIENKIHSREHDDQLESYYEYVVNKFCKYGYKSFFIYLTLDGDQPSHEMWYPLSHAYIQKLVKTVLKGKDLSDRCRIYLEDYSNALSGELMNDEELRETCLKIYKNHKQAIDLIIENLPSNQNTVCYRCKQLLEKNNNVILLTSSRTILRFTTKRIREKVGHVGFENWVSSGDLIVFELYVSPNDEGYIAMIVGPGVIQIRDAWMEYLRNSSLFSAKSKGTSFSFTTIQSKRVKKGKLSDEEYVEKFVQTLLDYVDKIVEIEKVIEVAPIDYETILKR
ncbi:PD-(D/E)XK nuclease superfamily protein [methanogenic archaeon mixed culture ISO4-G1]|nr:PD-(D/E)XK nuclease superfamily protein [methanogenic archaeon mixed culture ISO4-G1]